MEKSPLDLVLALSFGMFIDKSLCLLEYILQELKIID